jgi:predicted ATPase
MLQNYKSIAACDVALGPLTFLLGPNGAGKSNFVDALRFVMEGLRTNLDYAFRERGGIDAVRRRSGGHPTHFGIRVDFVLPSGESGHYSFKIGARAPAGFEVQREECVIHRVLDVDAFFEVKQGNVRSSTKVAPAAAPDRLYLVNASGLPEFRPVYELLSRMGFYNLNPDVMRKLLPPDAGDLLNRDGSNLPSVLGQLAGKSAATKERIEEYLAKVVPGIAGADMKRMGPVETVEFRQHVAGADRPWRFLATNMSDGTLRALGILVALFQSVNGGPARVPLIGIEEPEAALHPAAFGLLRDALLEASQRTQVLVTSHSSDLLDDEEVDIDSIRAVMNENGVTKIGRLAETGRSALRDRLYTAGELLRLDQIRPEAADAERSADQLDLFE